MLSRTRSKLLTRFSISRTSPLISNFSTSALRYANRAIVFTAPGAPLQAISCLTYPTLPPPLSHLLNVKLLLSPIDPIDIAVLKGKYARGDWPSLNFTLAGRKLQEPVFIGGSSGLAEVTEVGPGVTSFQKGDKVVLLRGRPKNGTWASARTYAEGEFVKVPQDMDPGLAATLGSSMTAYNLLRDFADLKEGDWVIQNDANSPVGQAVIQIASRRGLNTINYFRGGDSNYIASIKKHLADLGATHAYTHGNLSESKHKDEVVRLTGGKPIQLMLNWTGGSTASRMALLLDQQAVVVAYGHKPPRTWLLQEGPERFCVYTHQVWCTRHPRDKWEAVVQALAEMKLQPPPYTELKLDASASDDDATKVVRAAFRGLKHGQYNELMMFNIQEPADDTLSTLEAPPLENLSVKMYRLKHYKNVRPSPEVQSDSELINQLGESDVENIRDHI